MKQRKRRGATLIEAILVAFMLVLMLSGIVGRTTSAGKELATTGVLVNAMSRHLTLHEMAHAWTEWHDSPATIDRFLRFRGLASWNDEGVPWNERGWEQAAEFVAYGVGERILSPNVPDASLGQIARSYRLLTGIPLPSRA